MNFSDSIRPWLFEPSPHTGQVKTLTTRLATAADVARVEGEPEVVHVSELRDGERVLAVYRKGRLLWAVGQRYAITPGRGKGPAVGSFRLDELRYCATAAQVDAVDAAREGVASPEAFAEVWKQINGARSLQLPGWRLGIAAVERKGGE